MDIRQGKRGTMTVTKVLRTAFFGRLVPPTVRELLAGIVLWLIAMVMLYDILQAWWFNTPWPLWHWGLFLPVIGLFVWLWERARL